MGVRTRPGIKHDHGHNQQREALAEQHRDGTGAVLHRGQSGPGAAPAAAPVPSGHHGAWAGPSPCADAGLWPLPGAVVSSRMQGSGTPQAHPAPVPWDRTACAPGVMAMPGCGAQPHGSTQNYGFFFIYFFFLLFFGSKITPPGALENARLCIGGCCPASPSTQGSEQRCCSGEGTVGRSQILVPLFSQIPLLESAVWGTGPRATLLSHPMGRRCGSREEGQRMGTAQCLCEHVVAWDGAAGDGWGKTRILQNEDKVELSSRACGGRVCCHPWGRCGSLVWLLRLGRMAAWPLR